MKQKKILLTGGAGFIGSNLARALVQLGHKMLIYDDFSNGSMKNLENIKKKIKIVRGDILDSNKLNRTMRNFSPNIIFHLAAFHYIPECNRNPKKTIRINIEGMQNILSAVSSSKIHPYFIFISSAAVYSNSNKKLSEKNLAKPIDIYGHTKFFGEQLATQYCNNYKIPYGIIRLFNVYGHKDRTPHLIPEIVDQIKQKNKIIKLGNLESKRDFIFIDDVVNGLISLMKKRPKNITLNLGTGKEYSAKEIVKNIENLLGYKLYIKRNKNLFRKNENSHLCANNQKIKKILNWKQNISIKRGLDILLRKENIL